MSGVANTIPRSSMVIKVNEVTKAIFHVFVPSSPQDTVGVNVLVGCKTNKKDTNNNDDVGFSHKLSLTASMNVTLKNNKNNTCISVDINSFLLVH